METPEFFSQVPPIVMRDPLSEVLGAAREGILSYGYVDVVKLAGHSCPTVAGAYLMTRAALNALYPKTLPIRGEIRVTVHGALGEGTVGVIGNVASFITGATDIGGFHGLAGKFDRRDKLFYNPALESDMVFERLDTGDAVAALYNPQTVPPSPEMMPLMQRILAGDADAQVRTQFARLWQERVQRILIDRRDDPALVQCHPINK